MSCIGNHTMCLLNTSEPRRNEVVKQQDLGRARET